MHHHPTSLNLTFLEKRRLKTLGLHRARRQEIFALSRQICIEESSHNSQQSSEPQTFGEKPANSQMMSHSQNVKQKKKQHVHRVKKYAKLFQTPDWMVSVPEQFENFYGAALPSGVSALIVFNCEGWELYDRSGRRFYQEMNPPQFNANGTILEVVVNQKIIYVQDIISWNGQIQTTVNFQSRMNLITNLLPQTILSGFSIQKLSFLPINKQNLQILYGKNFGYQKDSFIFIQKDSLYAHQVNPNVLKWKNHPLPPQTKIEGIGRISWDGRIFSSDGFLLGKADTSNIIEKPQGLVKILIDDIHINSTYSLQEPMITMSGLQIQSFKNSVADPLSFFLMQYRAKHDPLKLEDLIGRLYHE